MRIALIIVGILCVLVGCTWLLQGINILRGSYMSGQTKWALWGALVLIAGIVVLVTQSRRRA